MNDPILLYAKDFGAIADGKSNAAIGIQKAVDTAAGSGKPAKIMLEAGEYRLFAETSKLAAILLDKAKNVTISGVKGKTGFTVENPCIGTFLLEGCENISIRNITIDYDPLPYTQGTVVAVDRENMTADIDIDENYHLPDEDYFAYAKLRCGVKVNHKGDETEYSKHTILASYAEHIKGRTYRIHTSARNQFNKDNSAYSRMVFAEDNFKSGDRMYYMALLYTQAGVCAWRSKNVSISGITLYAGPSITTMWALCENVHINGMTIKIKPGTDRILAVNADGVHALGVRNGILMENCNISGNGDDGVNIHTRSGIVRQIISDNCIKVDNHGSSDYRAGDKLQIMSRGSVKGTVDVKEVETENSIQTITFEPPVTGVIAGTSFGDSDNVLNLSACCQGSVFRNNVFGIAAGRSMLLSSHDILVENNTFRNINGWAINLSYDANYGEGPQPYNITVKGNTFDGVGCSRFPAFFLSSITPWAGGPIQGEHPIRNIVIEENVFNNPRNTIISSNGTDGLSVINNKVLIGGASDLKDIPLILLENSNGVSIKGFDIDDKNGKTGVIVKIGKSMDTGETGVAIEDIEVTAAGGSRPAEIADERI